MSGLMLMTDDGEMIPLDGVKYSEKEEIKDAIEQRPEMETRGSSNCGLSKEDEVK